MDHLKSSQSFHWFVTNRCFWTNYSKFLNVSSVSSIDLFRYECQLVICFASLKCHAHNVTIGTIPYHLLSPKHLLWMIASFSNFCFFWIHWILIHKEIMFKNSFFHRNLNWKRIVLINCSFFALYSLSEVFNDITNN